MASTGHRKRVCKIFITHKWEQTHAASDPIRSPYLKLKRMLDREPGFRWRDLSITSDRPVPGPYRLKRIEKEIHERLSACDVFVISETGVYSGGRPWFEREFDIALTRLNPPKPILIIKPRGTRFWAGSYASGADAWAVWTRKSIVEGIRCLVDLTPGRRKRLLAKGKVCPNCENGSPALELNRLKGVYCLNCGEVTHLICGETPSQAWPDRARVFWSNDNQHEAWSAPRRSRRR